jgi:hypothetical protein
MMPAISEQRSSEILDGYFRFVDSSVVPIKRSRKVERRGKQRSDDSLPARVWGIDSEGEVLSLDCRMENISTTGVYLSMPRSLRLYSDVSLVVRLLDGSGMFAAIRGKVLRDDLLPDGSRGLAVGIREHQLL